MFTGANSNGIISILLILGPCLAVLYHITVLIFLASFGEIPWNSNLILFNGALYWRLALMVVVLSLDKADPNQQYEYDNHYYIIIFSRYQYQLVMHTIRILFSLIPSLYFIRQTRRFVAGPEPNITMNIMNMMTDKVVIITGANTGIGKETARQLAARGATVILACRDEIKAKQAMQDIQSSMSTTIRQQQQNTNSTKHKGCRLFFLQLDLSSLESVRKAATTFATMNLNDATVTTEDDDDNNNNKNNNNKNGTNKLDVLINNAGVMFSEKHMSQDGFEMCMQANHLGHFLFTLLLLPHMNQHREHHLQQQQQQQPQQQTITEDSPRILNLTSITYKMATANGGQFNFQDYNCNDRPYTLFTTYSQSKLANILFTKELARRYPSILSLAINPGIVRTDVTRNMSAFLQYGNAMFGFLVQCYQKTPTEGAYSSVWGATIPTTVELLLPPSGSFIYNSKPEPTHEYCQNEHAARQLWEWSESMVQWKSN